MNFIKEIESLDINNKLDLKSYIYALEDRLSSINDMKPKSNSELYNKWLNRYNDLEDIVKITKEIKDEKKLKIVKKRLQEYQEEYGGLLRYNLVFKDNYKYEDQLLYDFFIVTSVFKYYCIINFNLFSKYMDRHIKNANIKDYPSYISSIFFSRIGLGPYVYYTADKYIF